MTYYAPAWGPNEKGEEVVYFLKQVTMESGSDQRNRIYFCSIKPDGSDRKEIVWLWKDQPDQFFENFAPAVTMEINAATKRAAIGVQLGQRSGIFVVGLDGKNFRSLWLKEWNQDRPRNVGSPTWSPDGEWIAFHEYRDEPRSGRIVKCRENGTEYKVLTDRDGENGSPAWSPIGNLIAYVNFRVGKFQEPHLFLMKTDGTDRQDTKQWGRYPRWSPDGTSILIEGTCLVDAVSGAKIRVWIPPGIYPKWGKSGFVSVGPMDIGIAAENDKAPRQLLKNLSRKGNNSDIAKEEFRW